MRLLRTRRRSALAPLLGNRGLLAIVVAGGLSSVGDWLYMTALPVLLFLRSGDLGLLGLPRPSGWSRSCCSRCPRAHSRIAYHPHGC